MLSIEKHQTQLLERITTPDLGGRPLDPAVEQAYRDLPRHRFVRRYRSKEWQEVNEGNLEDHLAAIYADAPLIIFADEHGEVLSTISQPSFVLRMLEMLKIERGHRVLELGTGSGWNAALIGHLVGPTGHVTSVEIIPPVAEMARETLAALGVTNVDVVMGDGGDGYAPGAPYDRITFTAGAYDLPRPFYAQIKNEGLMLMVLKSQGGGDSLFILRKVDDHFESVVSLPCGFVQMTGKHQIDGLEPMRLEEQPEWAEFTDKEISRTGFWWGGIGRESFMWRTLGIRSFLAMTEPDFQSFEGIADRRPPWQGYYFGLWDKAAHSLALVKDDALITYGAPAARERLLQAIHRWVDLGMPAAACFKLEAYPIDHPLTARANQWIVKRCESQFVWSLPA
jgi:protein-L-isoaspartate(D-aspartate) O-methyltransferase